MKVSGWPTYRGLISHQHLQARHILPQHLWKKSRKDNRSTCHAVACRLPFPIGEDGFDKGVLICLAMVTKLKGLRLADCIFIPGTAVFIVAGRRLLEQGGEVAGSINPQFDLRIPEDTNAVAFSNAVFNAVSADPDDFQVWHMLVTSPRMERALAWGRVCTGHRVLGAFPIHASFVVYARL